MMTSAEIITNKISRQITQNVYSSDVSYNGDLIQERIATIQSAMRNTLTETDCRTIALALSEIWTPIQNGQFDTETFNTIDMICGSIRQTFAS